MKNNNLLLLCDKKFNFLKIQMPYLWSLYLCDMLPKKLNKKLDDRKEDDTLRQLGLMSDLIDFSSNDYLGFARNDAIAHRTTTILKTYTDFPSGATGSRLLSGNHPLYAVLENQLSQFHDSEAALIFNSGYHANLGFLQSVPQRGDYILYDEYAHASIREGIRLSHARAFKFKHNNIEDLKKQLSARAQSRASGQDIYIITESIFSMDGDSPDLVKMASLCKSHGGYLVVDEAHATGVAGSHGQGRIYELNLQDAVFARIITFGKAIGAHGAAILGSKALKTYLLNFARSLIYTTALSSHSLARVQAGYELLTSETEDSPAPLYTLKQHITYFDNSIKKHQLQDHFISSDTPIQSMIIPGNTKVKTLSRKLTQAGYDVKPILSPTVPKGQERLRFCIHSFNTVDEIDQVFEVLVKYLPSLLS